MERERGNNGVVVTGPLSRKAFLRLSGAGIAGVALFGAAAMPTFGQTTPAYTSAHDLGIHPDNG